MNKSVLVIFLVCAAIVQAKPAVPCDFTYKEVNNFLAVMSRRRLVRSNAFHGLAQAVAENSQQHQARTQRVQRRGQPRSEARDRHSRNNRAI